MTYKEFIKEVDEKTENSELTMGKKVESEHKDVWEKLKKWSEEKNVELPLTEEELYEMIALAHLAELPDYYTRLKKMENE